MNSIESRRIHVDELSSHMPLKDKIYHAQEKIKEFLTWCEKDFYSNSNKRKEVLVSFSGGKDSTVLLDLILKVHKKMKSKIILVPAYAMEITFPETIRFINQTVENYKEKYDCLTNALLVRPIKPWSQILHTKGFPIYSKQISVMINRLKRLNKKTGLSKWAFGIADSARFKLSKKRVFLLDDDMTFYFDENNAKVQYDFSEKCCDFVKGGLKHDKRPSFVGTMASESLLRKKSWIKNGCNVFTKNHPMSRPLSLWTNNDVWEYIKKNNIEVNPAYDYNRETHNIDKLRFSRLGCTACPFGSSLEDLVHKKMLKDNEKISNNTKYWNRFEKLYVYNKPLYISQVVKTGIMYILMDMDVKIRNDPDYMEKYNKRRKEIDEWNKNFKKNFLKVLVRLENYKNRKENWHYTNDEINKALAHYGEELLNAEDKKFIKQYRKEIKSVKKTIN